MNLTGKDNNTLIFFPLLQQGFAIKVRTRCSIRTMLCNGYGISPEYVENRISTIFLDGRPVDDIGAAIVKDGSIIALSAAMPGLAGAVMRRGGVLASFRHTISHRREEERNSGGEGMVVIKLFNLLIKELGPTFLEQGIWIRREILEDFLGTRGNDIREGLKTAEVNGDERGVDGLSEIPWSGDEGLIRLSYIKAGD